MKSKDSFSDALQLDIAVATLGSRLRTPRSDFFPTQLSALDEIPMPPVARSVRGGLREP